VRLFLPSVLILSLSSHVIAAEDCEQLAQRVKAFSMELGTTRALIISKKQKLEELNAALIVAAEEDKPALYSQRNSQRTRLATAKTRHRDLVKNIERDGEKMHNECLQAE
jgi:hypothetical protein